MEQPWHARLVMFVLNTFRHFVAVRPTRMASSLSYYALFALVPVLVITFWVGSSVVDSGSLQSAIIAQASSVLGSGTSSYLRTVFVNAQNLGDAPWKAAVAVAVLAVLAVTGVAEAKQSIDDMWQTPYNSSPGWVAVAGKYLISIVATVGFAIVFILYIVCMRFFESGFTLGVSEPVREFLTGIGAPIILFVISTIITFLAYVFLPERRLPWRILASGAMITGTFLTFGNMAVGFYLAHSTMIASYGLAGSVIAILLWFYYSSLIFLFGAAATWEYYEERRVQVVREIA